MEYLIDAQKLSKHYSRGEDPVKALDAVTVQIARGELVAIIGRSGSGKSTLMNLLGCLDTPSSGSYLLDGRDVSQMPQDSLAAVRNSEIGFIFQGFHLLPQLTALENVALPLRYRGLRRGPRLEQARQALCQVGLASRLHHLPGELSGGQQQRVAIARAIAGAPRVIMADEPTGNLDSGSGMVVMELLLDLWRQGSTVILITHDQAIAARAQRVIEIVDGRVM